jgi:hypothetical protein
MLEMESILIFKRSFMKKILLIAGILALAPITANARDSYVRGYVKNDGSYVEPHYRTTPDSQWDNNYSSQGNTNPYTGQQGTVTYQQYQQRQQPSPYYNPYK